MSHRIDGESNPVRPRSDQSLIQDWANLSDNQAATELFERYCEKLLAIARRNVPFHLHGRISASEIANSAFGRVFNGARAGRFTFDNDGAFWQLLVSVALNKIRDELRRIRRRPMAVVDDIDCLKQLQNDPTPEQQAAVREALLKLKAELSVSELTYLDYRL